MPESLLIVLLLLGTLLVFPLLVFVQTFLPYLWTEHLRKVEELRRRAMGESEEESETLEREAASE